MHSNPKHFFPLILFVLILGTTTLCAQEKVSKIKIVNANEMQAGNLNPDLTKLIGDVRLRHKDINFFCDSAYNHEAQNMFEAFGQVHVVRGDTLHLWGNYLRYDGNKELAEVRKNVKLKDNRITVTTEFLDFNMVDNVAYYFNGGEIVDSTMVLNSSIGRYYTEDKLFFFKDTVQVDTKDYTLFSDTLKYNTVNHKVFILGPTRVVGEKETLYSEDGWYNTETNISQLLKNTHIERDEFSVKGDSIYVDKENGIGKLFRNIELKDTVNNMILNGHYMESYKNTEEAFLTDSAVMIQVSEQDSLFLHADTLRIVADSAGQKRVIAYNHVKFYRKDLQGMCDSLEYSAKDSTIRLFNNPILWAQENQITADTISIETVKNEIKYLHFTGSAYLCNQEDSTMFNQIKGKSMLGHVSENKLFQLDINGNGETLYYPKDKEEIMGANIAKSSNIIIRIKENQIDQIVFIKKPDGNMYPLGELPPKQRFLKDFKWLKDFQPLSKEDIFIWEAVPVEKRPKPKKVEKTKVKKKLLKMDKIMK